jgi:hypothetical protein
VNVGREVIGREAEQLRVTEDFIDGRLRKPTGLTGGGLHVTPPSRPGLGVLVGISVVNGLDGGDHLGGDIDGGLGGHGVLVVVGIVVAWSNFKPCRGAAARNRAP